MMQTDDMQAVGQQVAEALKENEQFYRTAAPNVMNPKVQALLQERAAQRASFSQGLTR